HPHELQPNHLEQRQKGDDQAAAIVDVAEQVVEAARLGFGQAREQLLDADLDRNLLRRQEDFRSQLRALDHRLKGGEEAEEIDLDLRLVFVAGNLGDASVGPQPLRRAQLLALVQQPGGGLELLVLEQAPHQRVARIFLLLFDAGGGLGTRQQHLRLDVNQRRRHDDVFAGGVEIELLHQRDGLEVLRRDQGNRDVVDVQLVLLDQVEQQIERSLEVR